MKELMKPQTTLRMIDVYNLAIGNMEKSVHLLAEAKKQMLLAFGDYRDQIFESSHCRFDYYFDDPERLIKNSRAVILKGAWKAVTDKIELRKLMTSRKYKEMMAEIEAGKLPEFTLENIYTIIRQFAGDMPRLLNESLIETFEYLRPRRSTHKTNSEYQIGKKVIKTYVMTSYIGVSHYHDQDIISLHNTFSLLDGKGPAKENDTLTSINHAYREKKTSCETEYFKFKWYGNGNLHIEFKRMDLVKELNRIGGASMLKKETVQA